MRNGRRSIVRSATTGAAGAAMACGAVMALLLPALAGAASAGDSHSCAVLDGGSVKVRERARDRDRYE